MGHELKPGDCFDHVTAVAPVEDAPDTWTWRCDCGRTFEMLGEIVLALFESFKQEPKRHPEGLSCPHCPNTALTNFERGLRRAFASSSRSDKI